MTRLNIALLTAQDASDRRSWSGTYYYIAEALQKHCGDVSFIGPIDAFREMLPGRLTHTGAQLLLRKNFAFRHTYAVSKHYAKVATKRLATHSFDVIIALSGATEMAFLETDVPIVLVEDANFAVLHNYHQHFSSLLESSLHQLNDIQARGIRKARLLLYSTRWAALGALDYYRADPQKVRVIPFGANLEHIPVRASALARTQSDRCRLLFVGVNWERKGGEIALETLIELEKLGIRAELTVCGCIPPKNIAHPGMKVIPFLDKNDEEQRKKLEALYMQADFFILPTRNECFGIAFCEANAFGLPVVTTMTGGVPEVVQHGENGFTLPYSARGDAYADLIATVYRDRASYQRLVQTSRLAFERRLNWDVWGEATRDALEEMLDRTPLHRAFTSQESYS